MADRELTPAELQQVQNNLRQYFGWTGDVTLRAEGETAEVYVPA